MSHLLIAISVDDGEEMSVEEKYPRLLRRVLQDCSVNDGNLEIQHF